MSSDLDELEYFGRRALVQNRMAEAAESPAIAAIHRDLAGRYEERVDSLGGCPAPLNLQTIR